VEGCGEEQAEWKGQNTVEAKGKGVSKEEGRGRRRGRERMKDLEYKTKRTKIASWS
jgi:hypothetical protein